MCIVKLFTLCVLINLFSFAKPTRCTCNAHNCTVFYHSKMFLHYCAIPMEFLHQVLNLDYIYIYVCVCVKRL